MSDKESGISVGDKLGMIFLFSMTGALLGGVVFIFAHLLIIKLSGEIIYPGILFICIGMGAAAFYLTFVGKEYRARWDSLVLILSVIISSFLTIFFDVMFFYASRDSVTEGGLLKRTLSLYKEPMESNVLPMFFAAAICGLVGLFASLLCFKWIPLWLEAKGAAKKKNKNGKRYK